MKKSDGSMLKKNGDGLRKTGWIGNDSEKTMRRVKVERRRKALEHPLKMKCTQMILQLKEQGLFQMLGYKQQSIRSEL